LKARTRRTMSTVLLGQRRMGKTEIFKRVVNRLFFEQDHQDPKAVVPIYYSFPDKFTDRWDFAESVFGKFHARVCGFSVT
jgi:AAA+ ATPase superfamily predicted ATPase